MNILTSKLSLYEKLKKAGLVEEKRSIIISGGQQFRYTLRLRKYGKFVAWFCWYEKPAVKRLYNPREHFVGITECTTTAPLTEEVRLLAQAWLDHLRDQHPFPTVVLHS